MFNAGASSNPLVQVVSFVFAGLALIGAVLIGSVILAFVLGFVVIFGIVFWLRIWWLRRKILGAQRDAFERHGSEDGTVIEVEYSVVDERETDNKHD